jgi:hypothetical protein
MNGTAFLFTGLVTLFLLGPFVFALVTIAEQAQIWAHQVAIAEKQGLAARGMVGRGAACRRLAG